MKRQRRVYVRGVGAVTSLGISWAESANALSTGTTAIRSITRFNAQAFPCSVAAEISDSIFEQLPVASDRRYPLAITAAKEATQMAQLSATPDRIGIYVGAESGRAGMQTILELSKAAGGGAIFDHELFGQNAPTLASKICFSDVSPAAIASVFAREFNAQGPCQTVSLACSSSSVAIAEAARAIRQGRCDTAICGGVGADVDPLMLAGFGKVGALSTRGISCPFDIRRDGFVVGEGAAMVVLSSEKCDAIVELVGEGKSLDAFHLTAPDPDGLGAERSMRRALERAGLDDVDYIQAHGTSTPLNDEIEARAIGRVFDRRSSDIPVSSIKGALGHWIAGAGALGFLVGWEAVARGRILPTAGLHEPDPKIQLRHVQGKALSREVRSCLVNAFAFGGANCSLVLKRCEE